MLDSQQSLANQNFGSHISEGAYSRVVKDLSDFLGSRVRVPFAAFAWKNKKYEKSTILLERHCVQRILSFETVNNGKVQAFLICS